MHLCLFLLTDIVDAVTFLFVNLLTLFISPHQVGVPCSFQLIDILIGKVIISASLRKVHFPKILEQTSLTIIRNCIRGLFCSLGVMELSFVRPTY